MLVLFIYGYDCDQSLVTNEVSLIDKKKKFYELTNQKTL